MQTEVLKHEIPVRTDHEHRRFVLGDEPMLFHCHHYNMYLQQSILDADYIDSRPFLIGAAAEVSYHQMSVLFSEMKLSGPAERKKMAERIFKWAGFGAVDLSPLGEKGGKTSTRSSHYVIGWQARNETPSRESICFFMSGWLAGTMAAVYNKPLGYFAVQETSCSATDLNEPCTFELSVGEANYDVFKSVGVGQLSDHNIRQIPATPVDYQAIYDAVSSMELVGNSEGIIPVFGVYLTRHYANYYNRLSYEFENAIGSSFGKEGLEIAGSLLTEAGLVCAFNTFGGIMESSEWDALIRPSLKSREDWVHGIVAVINTLGWGRWQVTKVSEAEAEFVIHDDYESVGYRAMYGQSDHPISYLGKGAAIGIMNLVYLANIAEKPLLTAEFYEKIFKGEGVYQAEALASRAMGDEATVFRAFRP